MGEELGSWRARELGGWRATWRLVWVVESTEQNPKANIFGFIEAIVHIWL
jgi:hypothetical protein